MNATHDADQASLQAAAFERPNEPPRPRSRRSTIRSVLLRYGFAILSVIPATWLTGLIISSSGRSAFALFYLAVTLSAWYGGLGPGLLATLLATLSAHYFFVPPLYTLRFDFAGLVQLGVFLLVALLISWLTGLRRQAEIALRQQSQHLQVTLSSIGDAVIATDAQGRITFMNPIAHALTGWSQADAGGRPLDEVFRIINEITRETVESPVAKVIREGTVVGLGNHTLLVARDGREIPIDDSGAPIRDEQGAIGGVILVFRDVTERRQAEIALRESEELFRQLAENVEEVFWVRDTRRNQMIYVSPAYEELWGRSRESLYQDPASFIEAIHPEDRERVITELRKQSEGELFNQEYRILHPDGSTRWIWARTFPVRDESGEIYRLAGIAGDITDLKRAEQVQQILAEVGQLLTSSLDYEQTLASVARLAVPHLADWCVVHVAEPDGSFRQLQVAHANPAKLEQAYEFQRRYPPRQDSPTGVPNVLRTGMSEFYPDIPEEMLLAAARDEEHLQYIRQFQMRSAMVVPLAARGRILGVMTFVWAESGYHYTQADLALAEELARRAALAIDNARLYAEAQAEIAARKRVEERLTLSLQEKEVLLREVHHRVKNNLQAVSNLLYLQSAYVGEDRVQQMFREAQDRIKSIALIYEKLYQTNNLAQINLAEYVSSLVEQLLLSYAARPESIQLAVQAENLTLSVDTAVPLGIIINELVTNSLKHAFPGESDEFNGRPGEIKIEARLEPDGRLALIFADNGVGLPADIDLSTTSSLGLRLVGLLTEYMRGTVDIERGEGTAFKIQIVPVEAEGTEIGDDEGLTADRR